MDIIEQMGVVTFGGGVTAMSGSIGGHTFSNSSGGIVVKAKGRKKKNTTPSQSLSKAQIAYLAKYWSFTLTDAQRQEWTNYGKTNPTKTKTGKTIFLGGHSTFVKLNRLIEIAGGTLITTPPPSNSIGLAGSLTISAVSGGGGHLTITLNGVDLVAGDVAQITCTPPINPGRRTWKNLLKGIGRGGAINVAINYTTAYIAAFGNLPLTAGQSIGVQGYITNQNTGIKGIIIQSTAKWT